MQYLEHMNFLEYFRRVEHKRGVGMQISEDQFLMLSKVKNKYMTELMELRSFKSSEHINEK